MEIRSPRLLRPDQTVASLAQLDLRELHRQGYRLLLLDLDNTLLAWRQPEIEQALHAWVEQLRQDFTVCLVSNASRKRLRRQAQVLQIDWVAMAHKPATRGLRKAMRKFECPAEQTVMIGDQLFTDVLAGNRLGLHTVLVAPLGAEQWWMKPLRRLEGWVLERHD